MTHSQSDLSWLAFPMHGQQKLLSEGYRTRDGHFIEWLGRLTEGQGKVGVFSRPEPHILRPFLNAAQTDETRMAPNTAAFNSYSFAVPKLRNRRAWWTQSLNAYRPLPANTESVPAIVWNPLLATSSVAPQVFNGQRTIIFDLLDDWTVHFAFQSIRAEVEEGYRLMFQLADYVTANSEGTLQLAHRFGRTDAVLLANGCDPERFFTNSEATGPTTIGYVGKIGLRVDLELIQEVAAQLPEAHFIFAGPILDKEYQPALAALSNVELLGDVHYDDMPKLLKRFDMGWVPHRVGKGEVGGDVIKTYEYRAAHLPVLTTPVIGAGSRSLNSVNVVDREYQAMWLREQVGASKVNGGRLSREPGEIPRESTWKHKAEFLAACGATKARPQHAPVQSTKDTHQDSQAQ
jgi:glycosyltransferase involved in cell wall biosynthesis